jgi:hypothetical protein
MSEPEAIATGFFIAEEKNPVAIASGYDQNKSAREFLRRFLPF